MLNFCPSENSNLDDLTEVSKYLAQNGQIQLRSGFPVPAGPCYRAYQQ